LHAFDINRVRVLLDGRSDHSWTEPIKAGGGFRTYLNPWIAKRPDDVTHPGFDFTRFNVPYWQKFERMLKYARDNDMIISVILGWNDTTLHSDDTFLEKFERKLKSVLLRESDSSLRPVSGSEEEQRYLRYVVARLGAYSNVTWDLGDDLDIYRDDVWTHDTGNRLYELDSYHHLTTSHPVDNQHHDRSSLWFGMTSFQQWERPIHGWMLEQRNNRQVAAALFHK
jgi:hypothetical protein